MSFSKERNLKRFIKSYLLNSVLLSAVFIIFFLLSLAIVFFTSIYIQFFLIGFLAMVVFLLEDSPCYKLNLKYFGKMNYWHLLCSALVFAILFFSYIEYSNEFWVESPEGIVQLIIFINLLEFVVLNFFMALMTEIDSRCKKDSQDAMGVKENE